MAFLRRFLSFIALFNIYLIILLPSTERVYFFYRSATIVFGSNNNLLFLSFSNYFKSNSDLVPSSISIIMVPCFCNPGWLLIQWEFQCFPKGLVYLPMALHSPQILSTYFPLSVIGLYVSFVIILIYK